MSSKIKTSKAKIFGRRSRVSSLSLILFFLWIIIITYDNDWTIWVVAARRNKDETSQGKKKQSGGDNDWRNWNYYQILGLEDPGDVLTSSKKRKRKDRAHISKAQIKSAFRKQAQIYHPDKVLQRQQEQQKSESQVAPNMSVKEATDRFVVISQAYETLVDEKLRADYDKKISSFSPNHSNDDESSHHAYTDTYHNYNDILEENQKLDVYSSPLQSPNGVFVAYLTPHCEFVIRRLHGYYFYDYNDESSIIWKTTKDAFHDQYGYSLYSTDRCMVTLSGPKLSVLFHHGLFPLTVWESTTPTLDDDDEHEKDQYLSGGRRRSRRSSHTYYMKLTDEGVLVIYRKRTYRTKQKQNTSKINLARGVQKIIRQAAKAVKASLFSKIRNARSSSSSKSDPNGREESLEEEDDECIWSSDGIAGRGGCTVYSIRRNVAVLQSSIINCFSIAWVGAVQRLENIMNEEWVDLDYLMKMAVDVGRLGRNWISRSYLNVKQAIRQQHERARERVDLH